MLGLLTTSLNSNFPNTWKGGDFMDRENDPARQAAIESQIVRMNWEGPEPRDRTFQPSTGRVLDERHPSTHPLAKVVLHRHPILSAVDIATVENPTGNLAIDPVVLKSVQDMDGRS